MSQTMNIPTLGLHDLKHVKMGNLDDCEHTNGGSLSNTHAMGCVEGNSVVSTPRSPPSGRTPRTPLRSTMSTLTSMHSPLRMVGTTSPCSVKIKASARLEGGLLVEMPASYSPKPNKVEGSAEFYPRELSFGNLLDNEGVQSRHTGHAQHPQPIGLPSKTDQEFDDSLPLSPRKRSRKCAPLRSSFGTA